MAGYYKKYRKKNENMSFKSTETVEEILQYPFSAWEDAGIKKETMEYFGCRVLFSESIPNKIDALYFPAYSKDGKRISGYQKKDLTIPKEEPGHFSAVGSVRNTCMMYGQKQCQHGGKKLWVTEGWRDLMSAWQALKEKNKGTQYENLNPNVVSIVNGTSNADKSVAHNEEFVRSFQQIVICMDNDRRLPIEPSNVIKGKEAEDLIGSYLSSNNLLVPVYPDNRNDLNEILLEDGFRALHDLLMWKVKPFQAEKIITFDEIISFDDFISPIKEGTKINGFPKLNETLRGFRDHELTTITGPPGSGKSSVAFEFMYQFVEQGEKVGLIMLEDPLEVTQKRIGARYCNINLEDFEENPLKAVNNDKDKLLDAYNFSCDSNNFIVLHHFGSIPVKNLMSKVKSLTASGCQKILIDHTSMVISGLDTHDERKDIDVLYTELAAFRAAHPVHLITVHHVDKKSVTQEIKRPTEPKWIYTNPGNLRGSGGVLQLSCNVIPLHIELLPSGKRGRVMIGVGKNRKARRLSDCDIFMMDETTGRFIDTTDWTYNKEKGVYEKNGGY